MEKIHAYSDMVVKYLLGREETKEFLLDFINAVFEDSDFEPILSIELKNPFNLKDFAADKTSILDVKAVDCNGRILDIEVQTHGSTSFAHRSLYYWAKLYTGQINEGDSYSRLKPVSCINILNFNLIETVTKFHSCYMITEKDDPNRILTDHLALHFVELPKITQTMRNSKLEKWSQFFKNEGEGNADMNKMMEFLIKDDPMFQRVHEEFLKFTADDTLREIYEARSKAQHDQATFMEDAREEGLKLGLEQGLEQGEHKKAIETARNLLSEGIDIKLIARVTGLSESEINNL